MRFGALIPAVFCTTALVLAFLCLFAGSKKGFMEDYAIVTLNTSRIGQNLEIFDGLDLRRRAIEEVPNVARAAAPVLATPAPVLDNRVRRDTPSFSTDFFDHATAVGGSAFNGATSKVGGAYSAATGAIASAAAKADKFGKETEQWLEDQGEEITQEVKDTINDLEDKIEDAVLDGIHDIAEILGLHDFYSAHIMTLCEGEFIPSALPNATLDENDIHKNVTSCTNRTAMYKFDPSNQLSQELNESTNGVIDLEKIQWPDDVEHALNALHMAQKATFVLYCLGIGFIFIALIASVAGVFFNGRLSAFFNVVIDLLAFISIMIASALVTVIMKKATHYINKYGEEIGVSAQRGNKFLALTWATTGLTFVAMVVWIALWFVGRRHGNTVGRKQKAKNFDMSEMER